MNDESIEQALLDPSDSEWSALDDTDEDSHYNPSHNSDTDDSSDSSDFFVPPRKRACPAASSTSQAGQSLTDSAAPGTSNSRPFRQSALDLDDSEDADDPVESQERQEPQRRGILQPDYSQLVWSNPVGNFLHFDFTGSSGMDENIAGILATAKPIQYFELFITSNLVQEMVDQTNMYAHQYLENPANDSGPHSRVHLWTPTTSEEMRKFLGLIGWMGLVPLPRLPDYWSRNPILNFSLPKETMTRMRFELLLKFWHFSNNQDLQASQDRLYKVKNLVDRLVQTYKEYFTPGEKICIDESMVPFRGRLLFKQYLPKKKSKYGIKIYKLCTAGGYTWNLKIYCGKDSDTDLTSGTKTENLVMSLVEGLTDEGRTLYADNFYSSIPLAFNLLDKKTHYVGTLRQSRKYLPPGLTQYQPSGREQKMKKGEIRSFETDKGVTVIKWQDQRAVHMLTTRHLGTDTTQVKTGRRSVNKPTCILDYDTGKTSVDLSDQLSSYSSALRKSSKWYRKVAIELIWGTTLVNAYHLYKTNSVNKSLSSTDFRMAVITSLLGRDGEAPAPDQNSPASSSRTNNRHLHVPHPLKKRSRCQTCYEKYGRNGKMVQGKRVRPAMVYFICSACDQFFCKECFNKKHSH